jgi:hypothetical protein
MERFLYRLAKSPFADRFILKGALLLTAWKVPVTRPTMDIDLAGKTSNKLEDIRLLVGKVCEFAAEPDGIEFTAASIEVQRIKEDAEYEGVRVRFNATLAKARIPMQIDIGFGDVIVPRPIEIEYPAMLEFPAPVLMAYPKETVVVELVTSDLTEQAAREGSTAVSSGVGLASAATRYSLRRPPRRKNRRRQI